MSVWLRLTRADNSPAYKGTCDSPISVWMYSFGLDSESTRLTTAGTKCFSPGDSRTFQQWLTMLRSEGAPTGPPSQRGGFGAFELTDAGPADGRARSMPMRCQNTPRFAPAGFLLENRKH